MHRTISPCVAMLLMFRALNAHPTAKLYITGHSLGGALATLAAFDLKQSSGIIDLLFSRGFPILHSNGQSI
jgi:alpha-beta hydrolase superfamily lysophospholipase